MKGFALAIAAAAWTPSTALAQEEVCSEFISHDQWADSMDAADAALAAFEPQRADRILEELRKRLPCMDSIAKPTYLGRFGRLMALVAFYEQDEITAVKWGMLQRFAAPDQPWPEEMSEDHPFREMLEFADDPILAGPEDKGLVFPKRGAVFLNGEILEAPKARAEVPGLVQVTDRHGNIVRSFWQDGAAFPEDILGPPGAIVTTPKWFVPEGGESGEAIARPSRPVGGGGSPLANASLPRLAAGGGLTVVATTLYALGAASRPALGKATNEDELVAARSRINGLVMGAGLCAAAGVGVGVTAFVDADGGKVAWTLRF